MNIRWSEIREGFAYQIGFSDGFSPLYHAIFQYLHALADQATEGDALKPNEQNFVDLLEDLWAERSISGSLHASMLIPAAIHAAVLNDDPEAADLRPFYGTVGGAFDPATDTDALHAALAQLFSQRSEALEWFLLEGSVQTNEVARSAAWLLTLYTLQSWRPETTFTLIDLGTSAGLNLSADYQNFLWDYAGQRRTLGAEPWLVQQKVYPDNALDPPLMAAYPATAMPTLNITGRVGIDLNPLDPLDPITQLRLKACIWGHQPERIDRLQHAIEGYERLVTAEGAPQIFQGNIIEAASLIPKLVEDVEGPHVVVAYNSAVTAYFTDRQYEDLRINLINAFKELPTGVQGIWLENEPPRYNETVEHDKYFLIRAKAEFMGGASTFYLGEIEAHPYTVYLREGWDMLRGFLGW